PRLLGEPARAYWLPRDAWEHMHARAASRVLRFRCGASPNDRDRHVWAAMIEELTPDAPGELVLRTASRLAHRFGAWGALEQDDYVGLACLGFCRARARWPGVGDFTSYALTHMLGQIREARRHEARHQKGFARSSKAVGSPFSRKSKADGRSALLTVSTPRTRRPGSRREHNRTYYQRHHGLQACEQCGALVERGHGARRCEKCADAKRRAEHRAWRPGAWKP